MLLLDEGQTSGLGILDPGEGQTSGLGILDPGEGQETLLGGQVVVANGAQVTVSTRQELTTKTGHYVCGGF